VNVPAGPVLEQPAQASGWDDDKPEQPKQPQTAAEVRAASALAGPVVEQPAEPSGWDEDRPQKPVVPEVGMAANAELSNWDTDPASPVASCPLKAFLNKQLAAPAAAPIPQTELASQLPEVQKASAEEPAPPPPPQVAPSALPEAPFSPASPAPPLPSAPSPPAMPPARLSDDANGDDEDSGGGSSYDSGSGFED